MTVFLGRARYERAEEAVSHRNGYEPRKVRTTSGMVELERPRVRVHDLPLAGRVTYLVWRKRRYRCGACGRTFTESHPELPERQRVTRRFRRRLFERVSRGGAL